MLGTASAAEASWFFDLATQENHLGGFPKLRSSRPHPRTIQSASLGVEPGHS